MYYDAIIYLLLVKICIFIVTLQVTIQVTDLQSGWLGV